MSVRVFKVKLTSRITSLINLTLFDLFPLRLEGFTLFGSLVTLCPLFKPTGISIAVGAMAGGVDGLGAKRGK